MKTYTDPPWNLVNPYVESEWRWRRHDNHAVEGAEHISTFREASCVSAGLVTRVDSNALAWHASGQA
eukprot:242369-Amphidinium_carterae.1